MRAAAACLLLTAVLTAAAHPQQRHPVREPALPLEQLARQNFGNDAPWYLDNIPFLEIDDPEIQQIYYYRWKLFRSHIREIGPQGQTVLEFLPNVPWARQPFTDLNDSAAFHLREGRWLRTPTLVNSLIDHLYTGGANDRHFSEWIAAATNDTTLVTGDPTPALRHLDTMQHIFNLWDDHLDRRRNLYWIEPLLDATEYTISSIDASGAGFDAHPSPDAGRNGFTGGFAFRRSINAYQYANALAIARLATIAGQPGVAADYTSRAAAIRAAVLTQLWNPTLTHLTDRYQRSTPSVQAGEFIRGRELVGYVPWMFELPPASSPELAKSWWHVLNPAELGGSYGLRTVEPTYPRYMTQYRYDAPSGMPECQWNGPSWPFQTAQTLTGLANLLDDYPAAGVTASEYLRLLRQYTHQHYVADGRPDLQEDYDPDSGRPIVGLPRSHHYSHSTYVDLVLNGLLGIRPRADEVLELRPLIPTTGPHPIRYFALERLAYHGHTLALLYDADGSRYHIGRGLTVFVDGKPAAVNRPLAALEIPLPATRRTPPPKPRIDLAVNAGTPDGPTAAASTSTTREGPAEAIDGRLWFFPEIPNGWSPTPTDPSPTYTVTFEAPQLLTSVELYFLDDGANLKAPRAYQLQAQTASGWQDISPTGQTPQQPVANGLNRIRFPAVTTKALRVLFPNPAAPVTFRLIELKAFGPAAPRHEPGTPGSAYRANKTFALPG